MRKNIRLHVLIILVLCSYEDLETGKLSLYSEKISGLTIYRGWMMKTEMYAKFYSLLWEKGIILINAPEEYEKYHTLPAWYSDLIEETAESVWESEGNIENALAMARSLEYEGLNEIQKKNKSNFVMMELARKEGEICL